MVANSGQNHYDGVGGNYIYFLYRSYKLYVDIVIVNLTFSVLTDILQLICRLGLYRFQRYRFI